MTTTLTMDRLMAHAGWVRRLARTLVRDDAAAEDFAHDALLVALHRPPQERDGLRSWFGRVITNRIRMEARGERRRVARERLAVEAATAPSTPEELTARLELQERLARAIFDLGETYRQVLFLRFFEDRQPAEIAQLLGIPPGTVRWRLKTGLDELRARLTGGDDDRERLRLILLPLIREGSPARGGLLFPWLAAGLTGAALVVGVLSVRGVRPSVTAPAPRGPVRPAGRLPPPAFIVPAAVATTMGEGGAVLAAAGGDQKKKYPKLSPFSGLRWRGDVPEVLVDGKWYELRGLAGVPSARIITFAKQRYRAGFPPQWRKRLSEDLVEVLAEMGSPPGEKVELELKDLTTGAVSSRPAVAMTEENRRQVWRLNNRAPFDDLRMRGDVPEVALEGTWYELVSIDAIPREKLVGLCRDEVRDKPEKLAPCCALSVVDALSLLGRPPGETVDLGLKDLSSGATTTRKGVPLTNDRWAHLIQTILR